MICIHNMNITIPFSINKVENEVKKRLQGNPFFDLKIERKSLDCRKSEDLHYVVSASVKLGDGSDEKGVSEEKLIRKLRDKNITILKKVQYHFPYLFSDRDPASKKTFGYRPVIVGTGPAGYFAALVLARAGACPLIFERGKAVEERSMDVEGFWNGSRPLDPESNVSFGEGGAGTFSDGKLFTGNKDKYGLIRYMLEVFHEFGAPEEILYEAKPHIGTDVLKTVMKNMREEILALGGEIHFSTRLEEIRPLNTNSNRPVYQLSFRDLIHETDACYETDAVILAIGHSARDTFSMLYRNRYQMEQKPFAVGLRVEHPRETIDHAQYGSSSYDDILPAADYKLTYHASNGRNVFSFCMCPGGYVVNATSDPESIVVNGMSYSDRAGANSNSALVVGVTPEDYPGEDPMDAILFQQELERKFFLAGEKKAIPIQRYEDFMEGRPTKKLGTITPQIKGDFILSELSRCFPKELTDAILEAMPDFGRKITGFDHPDTVFSGVESRTSSPVRITRDDDMMAVDHPGIFPAGEGAGYAGGITSAAVDGIRAAEKLASYISSVL